MDTLVGIGVAGTLYVYLIWQTVVVGRLLNPWVLPTVLVIDHLLLFLAPLNFLFPCGALVWKLSFLYFAWRWEPLRGMYHAPRWPRRRHARGPRRTENRQFQEPSPWDRGPCSF